MTTRQTQEWAGNFGRRYTERNPCTQKELETLYADNYGVSRQAMNHEFIGALPRDIVAPPSRPTRVLEIGCNLGVQLEGLQVQGFKELWGIDINDYALDKARKTLTGINFAKCDAFDLPFRDGYFDLVFTSGTLIAIAPEDLGRLLDEIYRCSSRWIWGFEYYSPKLTEIPYHGHKSLLWKCDFAKAYLDRFPDLVRLKERHYAYRHGSVNIDTMFLLEKQPKPK